MRKLLKKRAAFEGVLNKKLISLLLAVIIASAALSGCVFPRENPDWRELMGSRHLISDTSETQSEDTPTKPEELPLDYTGLYGKPQEGYEGVIGTASATQGYSEVTQLILINERELFYILSEEEGEAIYLYDIFNGIRTLLLEKQTHEAFVTIYEDGSAVVASYYEDGTDVAFFKELAAGNNMPLLTQIVTESNVVSSRGRIVYVTERSLTAKNPKNGATEVLAELPLADYYDITVTGDFIYVNGYSYDEDSGQSGYYIYSIETQKGAVLRQESSILLHQGGSMSLFSVPDYTDMLYFVEAALPNSANIIALKSIYEEPVWSGDGFFITRQTGPESIIRLYDTKELSCVSELRLNGTEGAIFGRAALSGDKKLISAPVYSDNGAGYYDTVTLFLILTDGKTPPEGKYTYDSSTDYDKLNKQGKRAYDIGKEYGVIVNIYDNAVKEYPTYKADALNNNYLLGAALDCLDNVLSKFPKGFFVELCNGDTWEMEFNITGRLSSDSEEETVDARAFYYVDRRNRHIIVADCSYTYKLEQTFAHEIMHAMDRYIYNEFPRVKNDGYPNWYDYLPSGFEYNDSYFDEDGEFYTDTAYVYKGTNSSSRVYFIDSYQKTYDFEDRAVLFQYIFVVGDGFSDSDARNGLDRRFDNIKIHERAEYMCSMIRKYFKTIKATDQAHWEKALGINNPSVSPSAESSVIFCPILINTQAPE